MIGIDLENMFKISCIKCIDGVVLPEDAKYTDEGRHGRC